MDTIIFSIDGINKKTYESIRVGVDFDQVISNVKNFIKIRNTSGKTRVVMRFIRQESNKDEWPQFNEYWSSLLNEDFGDEILYFDIHNWGGTIKEEDKTETDTDDENIILCSDLFERFYIYSDGKIGFCCADDNGFFEMENIVTSDPIDIFNNEIFTYYRMKMKEGKIQELEVCKSCSIPFSRSKKMKSKMDK